MVYVGNIISEFWGKMISKKQRKNLIIKYLQKNPLSSPRQIRENHSTHEYHSTYLKTLLEELICEEKIGMFLKRYYVIPKSCKETNLLINIIKSASISKPTFKKLKFIKTKKNPTLFTIINNCICLYHLKLKINKLEKTIPIQSFDKNFIKFLKSFSDNNYYIDFMVEKNFFKKNPAWKKMDESNNTPEKRISRFLRMYWDYSLEYHSHLKNNKTSLKELFNRVFQQHNEGKSITAEKLGITNKALKRSLDQLITEQGVLKSSTSFDSQWNVIEPKKGKFGAWNERSRLLDIGLGILGHRLPSKRKKYAKIAEENTGIPFTKLIPMKGYSTLLKEAPTDPFQSIDPRIRRDYEAHYNKIGIPPLKIIPTDGSEPYYLFHDPKYFSKLTREWKGTK